MNCIITIPSKTGHQPNIGPPSATLVQYWVDVCVAALHPSGSAAVELPIGGHGQDQGHGIHIR